MAGRTDDCTCVAAQTPLRTRLRRLCTSRRCRPAWELEKTHTNQEVSLVRSSYRAIQVTSAGRC
jgi:hypothetical protein